MIDLTENLLTILLIATIVLVLYFLPSIVGRKTKNSAPIFALNLFLGWSILGWVIALVWALHSEDSIPSGKPKKCPKCAEEIKAEAELCRFCGYRFSPPIESKLSDEEIKKNEIKLQLEILRTRFNGLAEQIHKAKSKEEKIRIENERTRIGVKMTQLRGQL